MDADRQRISAIAHAGSAMWGPIDDATIATLVDGLAPWLTPQGRVIDLGCGPAELLRRICERSGASGVGIDASPHAIDEAHRRLQGSTAESRVELRLADVRAVVPGGDHDLAICVGPGWAAGGWTALAAWVAGFVRPGGHLLLGDGAWRARPSPTTLARLGMNPDDYLESGAVRVAVEAAGLEVERLEVVTPAAWDAYGERYRSALRAFARDHPGDRIADAVRARAEDEWATYELLHATLDFVLVHARRAVIDVERRLP